MRPRVLARKGYDSGESTLCQLSFERVQPPFAEKNEEIAAQRLQLPAQVQITLIAWFPVNRRCEPIQLAGR